MDERRRQLERRQAQGDPEATQLLLLGDIRLKNNAHLPDVRRSSWAACKVPSVDRYYTPDGTPTTLTAWVHSFSGQDREASIRVAKTTLHDGTRIFTACVGLDHSYVVLDHSLGHSELPIIFETMVFPNEGEEDMERYATVEEARAGHYRMVAKRQAGNSDSTIEE